MNNVGTCLNFISLKSFMIILRITSKYMNFLVNFLIYLTDVSIFLNHKDSFFYIANEFVGT